MNKLYKVFFTFFLLVVMLFAGSNSEVFTTTDSPNLTPPNKIRANFEVKIKKIDNVWRFVRSDSLNTKVKLKKGVTITMVAEGTDVYLQFMDEDLFGMYTAKLTSNVPVEFTVEKKARKGENKLAAFCTAGSVYAVGSSPPVIIIK